MTIESLLRSGVARLRAAGADTPRLDAELLLARALGVERGVLLTRLREVAAAEATARFDALLARRALREPVAYIMGEREFWGRRFIVTPDVLVPRPETELLVERALAIAAELGDGGVAADLGSGSGCVAVTLTLELPRWRVYATDTSVAALDVARRNAALHGALERVRIREGSLLDPVPEQVDLVVANLPYVRTDELAALPPEVREWEPHGALDGGADGLDPVRALLPALPGAAACLLELDPRQFDPLERVVGATLPRWGVRRWRDLAGADRVAELRPLSAPRPNGSGSRRPLHASMERLRPPAG